MSINVIDVLFSMLFVGIIAYGFFAGILRLGMLMISIYLSVIVAGFFYAHFADVLRGSLPTLQYFTAQLLAFLLVALIGTAALAFTMFRTFAAQRLPNFLASFDQVGGASLGIIVGLFTSVVMTIVLRVYFGLVLSAANAGFNVTPFLMTLALHMQSSFLTRFFVQLSLPIFTLIAPWFPNGLPAILSLTP